MTVFSAPPDSIRRAPAPHPQWMRDALADLRQRYPDDVFTVALKAPGSEVLRLRCADCPGKYYNPGPGESLSNFTIHLKNRIHRQNVNKRLGELSAKAGGSDEMQTD